MTHYLIDIRMMGSVKHQIHNLSNHLAEKFNLGNKLVTPAHHFGRAFFDRERRKTDRRFHKNMYKPDRDPEI